MIPRGRGNNPYRGRGGRGERVIAQHGSQRLVASQIANTASSSTGNTQNNTLYEEFLEYKKKKEQDNKTATYANIASEEVEEESDSFLYEKSFAKEVILLLDYKDLQFENEP